mmetsp:Transcript_42558/g.101026  ORF Transcript_42558/g.101026 Transcript_42558/m.101026 type:complete len:238 (+) Transcript_42558:139-852(+)
MDSLWSGARVSPMDSGLPSCILPSRAGLFPLPTKLRPGMHLPRPHSYSPPYSSHQPADLTDQPPRPGEWGALQSARPWQEAGEETGSGRMLQPRNAPPLKSRLALKHWLDVHPQPRVSGCCLLPTSSSLRIASEERRPLSLDRRSCCARLLVPRLRGPPRAHSDSRRRVRRALGALLTATAAARAPPWPPGRSPRQTSPRQPGRRWPETRCACRRARQPTARGRRRGRTSWRRARRS